MQLYKAIDDIQRNFNFSYYTSESMKEVCLDHMVEILKMYKDPNEMSTILETDDIEGKDCIWYIT